MFDFFDPGFGIDDAMLFGAMADPSLNSIDPLDPYNLNAPYGYNTTPYDDIYQTPQTTDPRKAIIDVKAIPVDDAIAMEGAKRRGGALVRQPQQPRRRVNRAEPMQYINRDGLRKFGRRSAIGAGIAGLTGAAVNAAQEDSNGNLLLNPVTEAALATALGAGGGYVAGAATAPNSQSIPLANKGAVLVDNDRFRVGQRRGMRGAAIGATGAALLSLASQLRDQPQ